MFTLAALTFIGLGIWLLRIGYKRYNEVREYEFNNRSGGGVVQYRSLKEADRSSNKKQRAGLMQVGGFLLMLWGAAVFLMGMLGGMH